MFEEGQVRLVIWKVHILQSQGQKCLCHKTLLSVFRIKQQLMLSITAANESDPLSISKLLYSKCHPNLLNCKMIASDIPNNPSTEIIHDGFLSFTR